MRVFSFSESLKTSQEVQRGRDLKMAKANNLAYDYSVYEPSTKQAPERKIQVKKNTNTKTVSAVKALITAIAAFFLLCAILYGKVEASQIFNETSKLNTQLAVVSNENVSLQTDLESKTALTNVEEYANSMGLKKLDKSQTICVEVQKENVITVVGDNSNNPFVSVKNWFSGVLEYIGA